jgi:hypothetical protein
MPTRKSIHIHISGADSDLKRVLKGDAGIIILATENDDRLTVRAQILGTLTLERLLALQDSTQDVADALKDRLERVTLHAALQAMFAMPGASPN